MLTIVCGSA